VLEKNENILDKIYKFESMINDDESFFLDLDEVEDIILYYLNEDNFDYAVVQEFGSRFRNPKPYFYPNIYRNLKLLTNRINRKIKESLK